MCHPQIIGQHHRMRMLERMIQHILAKGDAWIAAPVDVAKCWASQRKAPRARGARR